MSFVVVTPQTPLGSLLRDALVHHSIPRRFPSREREMKRPERERESFVSLDDPAQREKKRKKKKPHRNK